VKIDPDAMAFPQPMAENPFGTTQTAFEKHPDFGGLSIRAHFASLAMQGMLANPSMDVANIGDVQISQLAVFFANGLIHELNK